MNEPIYIAMTGEHFRSLVAGKITTVISGSNGTEVKIILSDIGWPEMMRAIADAITGYLSPDSETTPGRR